MKTTVNNNNIESNGGFQIGDKVKHFWFDDVATITAKRRVYMPDEFGFRWLYTLDFGHSVKGPFGKDYNGEEFLTEAIKPLQQPTRWRPPTEKTGAPQHGTLRGRRLHV